MHNLADDGHNLFRDTVVDHVPGARHLDELAPGQFRLQPAGLAIAIDDFIVAPRHDRDRQRQFGMVLCQACGTRDHQRGFRGTGPDLRRAHLKLNREFPCKALGNRGRLEHLTVRRRCHQATQKGRNRVPQNIPQERHRWP